MENIEKIKMNYDIIDSIHTPYIMGLDAYDILVLRNPAEAVEKFKAMDCDMLFNGELVFYPDCGFNGQKPYITEEWKNFESQIATSRFAYLNSGAYIAKTGFFRTFIKECMDRKLESLVNLSLLPAEKSKFHQKVAESDQALTHWIFKDYYPQIRIDYNTDIFIDIANVPRFRNNIDLLRHFYEIPLSERIDMLLEVFRRSFSSR